jgi:hypothetical protein
MDEQEQLQAEGEKLAKKHGWEGLAILKVCEAALTDANFHHESEIIDQMIKALENGDQPAFTLIVINSGANADESEDDETNGNYSY